MNSSHLSDALRRILVTAHEDAVRLASPAIALEHLAIAILHDRKNRAAHYLSRREVDFSALEHDLTASLHEHIANSAPTQQGELQFTPEASELIQRAHEQVKDEPEAEVNEVHLLIALMQEEQSRIAHLLFEHGMTLPWLRKAYRNDEKAIEEGRITAPDQSEATPPASSSARPRRKSNQQPRDEEEDEDESLRRIKKDPLAALTTDLTAQAEAGLLDPIVGREKEVERLVQVLARRRKNNPLIVGDPGVGKNALVESLAQRIASGNVPNQLLDRRIAQLNLTDMVAGTKYRGEFEERMTQLISVLKENKRIILFIDELHTVVGAGSAQGSLDAAAMLKPSLAKGDFQCIAATTTEDFRRTIESDSAFERRFQPIQLEPCTTDQTREILNQLKPHYEAFHGVHYGDEALNACIELTERYVGGRAFPDKAIDALDESGARVAVQAQRPRLRSQNLSQLLLDAQRNRAQAQAEGKDEEVRALRNQIISLKEELSAEAARANVNRDEMPEVDATIVAQVVSAMAKMPIERVSQSERERLIGLPQALKEKVIGQDPAVNAVAKAIRRNRSGLKDPNRPIGTFLFLGPTGVGKTQLAKVLAQQMFDSERHLIRIDMSEFRESHSTSRLVGSPPGYVGYGQGGQLTEAVSRHPYSIVLLDEIEKAAPTVFNLLLQLLDEGRLTESTGRVVSFRNTIVIMTSNVGSRRLQDFGTGIGFATGDSEASRGAKRRQVISDSLQKTFPPEFINRIDELVFFDSLGPEAMRKILLIELDELVQRVREQGIAIEPTEAALARILEQGYDPKYGARPLKRTLRQLVEDPLADLLIEQQPTAGTRIRIDAPEGSDALSFHCEEAKPADTPPAPKHALV